MQQELDQVWKGWKIDHLMGEGAFGKVYKIVKEEFGHTYQAAMKVMSIPQNLAEIEEVRNDGMDDHEAAEYFYGVVGDIVEEFTLMSKLKGHSNIVSYEDHAVVPHEDKIGWNIYIRMELLTPLYAYAKEHEMTNHDIIRLGMDICAALETCQKYHIIHRDIKPENMFISDFGRYKLGDFGIARQIEKTTAGLSKKGTYTYMAPEVYLGKDYDATVDIYSLGIVLYRFLNGNRAPFLPLYPRKIRPSDKRMANVKRMNGMPFPKPCNASERLSEIILKACAYDPKDRYQDPADMRRELEECLAEECRYLYTKEEGPAIEALSYAVSSKGESKQEETKQEELDYELTDPLFGNLKTDIPSQPEVEEQPEPEETKMVEETSVAKSEPEEQPEPEEATEILTQTEEMEETESEQEEYREDEKDSGKKKKILILVLIILALVAGCVMFFQSRKRETPNLKNLSVEEARQVLAGKEYGLVLKEMREEYSDQVKRGYIISQNPIPGSTVTKGDAIQVVVSAGELKEIPSIEKKSLEKAKELLEKEGFVLKISDRQYSDTVKKGWIISQKPDASNKAGEGSTIEVVVSKGIEEKKRMK